MASSDLDRAIQAVCSGNPQLIAEANSFLLSYVDSDEAWQPTLDIIRRANNDFVCSFASNFLHTKIRKHWSKLNQVQKQEVFGVLSNKLADFAKQPTMPNKLAINRISLALLCICSRLPDGIPSFASQAFTFYSSPELQCFGAIPPLISLEMLTVIPGEVAQLDLSRDARLDLDQAVLSLLVPVLQFLQSVALRAVQEMAPLRVNVSGALLAWLPVGVSAAVLYTDYKLLFEFVLSEISSPQFESMKNACSIVSQTITLKEHPRPSVKDEIVFWVLSNILKESSKFSKYFGMDGDDDMAFQLVDCVCSVVAAELTLLSRPDCFQKSVFDLLLSFLSQKPRKLAAITFDVWCELEDISERDRHPFLAGNGSGGDSVYTAVTRILVRQCERNRLDPAGEDDIDEFRDPRQVKCYFKSP